MFLSERGQDFGDNNSSRRGCRIVACNVHERAWAPGTFRTLFFATCHHEGQKCCLNRTRQIRQRYGCFLSSATALHLRLTVRSLSNTGTATMDDRDFEYWKVCWKINLFFQGNLTCVQKCVVCEQVEGNGDRVLRSTFWREATTCSAGHYQLQPSDTTAHVPVVCYRCDQTYVFDVVKGKHTCRVQNCRRILRVNNDAVSGKLDPKGSTNFTLEKDPVKLLRYVAGYHSPRRWVLIPNARTFLSFVQQCRVYECVVCSDDVPYPEDMAIAYKLPSTACNHDRNACNGCLTRGFESAIRGGTLQDLVCLDSECRRPVSKGDIRLLVSPEVFRMFEFLHSSD